MQDAKLKNYLHFHFIVFIFGFTAILGELISIDALPLVWYRMTLAMVFIYLYIRIFKIPLKVSKKILRLLCLAGVIIAIHWVTFFAAIKASNISVTLAVLSSGALFTSILEPIFYKRKAIWYELFFGIMVICGLYVIFNVEGDFQEGIVLALISALFSSVFSLINGKIAGQYAPSMISFYEILAGVVAISVYLTCDTFLSNGTRGFSKAFFVLQSSDWMYLGILASVCTAYAFIASVKVMKYLSPYTVMLTINLEPVYGIILAVIIFGDKEKMDVQFYYGALLIITTVVLNGVFKVFQKRKIGTS